MPRKDNTHTVKVLGSIEINDQTHLILKDFRGFETKMPASLVKANELEFVNESKLVLTEGLYEKWIIEPKYAVLNKQSLIILKNLHKVYENKDLILNHKGYYHLGFNWLYSGGLWYGTLWYCLGSLFKEWETNPKLKKENGFIYKISGSMLSGANHFETLNMENQKFENGYIDRLNGDHWTNYLLIFKELSKEPKNNLNANFKYSNEIIKKLDLK